MVYVARFSNNIEGDIERGWSGYMGHDFASPAHWAKELVVADDIAEREGVESIDDVSNDDIVYCADQLLNTDLRFDAQLNRWRVCHHEGLSCWALDAETLEDAITEATAKTARGEISWSGIGFLTGGTVKCMYSKGDMHILECDGVSSEL